MKEILSQFGQFKVIDLTHSLSSRIPSWDGSIPFQVDDEDRINMLTSAGTHIDAPSLFSQKGKTVDQLSFDQLFGPAHVLNVSKEASSSYEISRTSVEHYEAKYGPILENSIVVGFTGWDRHWANPRAYRNADSIGQGRFPAFSLSAIEALLERKVAGIAIDTLAIEPLDSAFPCHNLLLGEGKYIIENIANAALLPPKGGYILALPLKIAQGSEAPARVIGFINS